MKTRHVIGCMSGTSLDAVDAVLVRLEGEGLEMRAEFVRGHSETLQDLAKLLRPITRNEPAPIGDVVRYINLLSHFYTIAIDKLTQGGSEQIDLIGVHGQTMFHEPPNSLQAINPHLIANESPGVPVAFDFRGADIAAGGCGAPITPLSDHILFRDKSLSRVVLNLGGFANFTWLAATQQSGASALASIRGGDICACNLLLDYIARRWMKRKYDKDGTRAANGIVHPEAEQMLDMMLGHQAANNQSLGTGDEMIDWAKTFQHHCNADDLAATACSVIGRVIAKTIGDVDQIIVAGGGSYNPTLLDGIRGCTRSKLLFSDELGMPREYREGACMAVLTALARDGVSITLPQVTGRFEEALVMPCWVTC